MISILESQPAGAEPALVQKVEAIFSPSGILSRAANFEFRPQQQQMAVAVAQALHQGQHLVVEAGTGVGKSLAYLVPAILHAVSRKKKALISTHTINLQEQLTEKDLPMLEQVLRPVEFRFAMLKGRANYLCTRRLDRAMRQSGNLFTSSEAAELQRICDWSKTTAEGSLSDFDLEPEPKVWGQVCSERGLCSPKSCGFPSEFARDHPVCFFQKARSRILSADLVVLNHTLFFTLLGGLEEEPSEGVLFRNDFVIFDEAHHLENVASKHIGLSLSSGQVRYAIQRLWNPRTQKGLLATLVQGAAVKLVADVLRESDDFFSKVEAACNALDQGAKKRSLARGEIGSPRAREWTEIRIRQPELVEDNLSLPILRLRDAVSEMIQGSEEKETGQELIECNRRLDELRQGVGLFLNQSAENHVYWVERSGRAQQNLALNAAPVDVAQFLRRRVFGAGTSAILTSATLAVTDGARGCLPVSGSPRPEARVGGAREPAGLNYFSRRVGAEGAARLQVGTPFDYERQMKLFVVSKMPDPREADYRDALQHWIQHFVRLTHGKAFVLFTNFKLMQELGERMQPFFDELGLACLVQGTGTPRSRMLEKFKEDIDSVLFGTDSFWQGVDVPGAALSNVIITRLPFAVPDHPLIEARIEVIEARGGDAFRELSLPEAILKFRQGVGRLIRTKSDSGIIVALDNRLLTKRYGQAFLDAMPKCPVEVV